VSDTSVDLFRQLADPRGLREAGLFVVEGRQNVAHLLTTELEILSLLATPAAIAAIGASAALRSVTVHEVSAQAMQDVTGFNFHRGVLAMVRRPPLRDLHGVLASVIGIGVADRRPSSLLVVAEHLTDADNVGSVFRNARALGAAAVLLDDRCVDPLYRKAVRTSMGSVLDLPWTQSAMADILGALAQRSVQTIGLTPQTFDADAPHVERRIPHFRPVVRTLRDVLELVDRSRTIALVVGNEGNGLSDSTLAQCTHMACIPMAPPADSINVATALAVALYGLGMR